MTHPAPDAARFAGEDHSVAPVVRLDGKVRAPSSKSVSNRALVCAALGRGESLLKNLLLCDDTRVMMDSLRTLGVEITSEGGLTRVPGTAGRPGPASGRLDAGTSGTSARFLASFASLTEGRFVLDGSPRMRERPMEPLVDSLVALGARIRPLGRSGFLPIEIQGGTLLGGDVEVSGTTSSQFASALLLAAPCMPRGLDLVIAGEPVSRPYLDTTLEVMRSFGARIGRDGYRRFKVHPGGYRGTEYPIPGDWSSAAYFLSAAAVTGGRVRIDNLPEMPTQADRGVLRHLAAMGCTVAEGPGFVEVRGPGGPGTIGGALCGFQADLRDMPDAALALAVVAAFAVTPTTIEGLQTLPFKEADRLSALENELAKIGASVERGSDWLRITPGARPVPGGGPRIETYGDHRMAMAFAVAGLRIPGLRIADPGCVVKTFPDYFEVLESLCLR